MLFRSEAVHHLTHRHGPLAAAALARRNQRFNQLPFGVGQIARISQLAAVVALSDSSPSTWVTPLSNQVTPLESQVTHRIQYLSGRTLKFFVRMTMRNRFIVNCKVRHIKCDRHNFFFFT